MSHAVSDLYHKVVNEDNRGKLDTVLVAIVTQPINKENKVVITNGIKGQLIFAIRC